MTRFLQFSCSTDCNSIQKDFTPSVPSVLSVLLFVCVFVHVSYVNSCRADAAVMSHVWEYVIMEEATSLNG